MEWQECANSGHSRWRGERVVVFQLEKARRICRFSITRY
jgi:hypothetical protein